MSGWGYRNRPAPTVTGGGGKASGIELFDQQTRKKMLAAIASGEMEGNGRVVNPNTPLDPIRVTPEEAAMLQSYPPFDPAEIERRRAAACAHERPATTIAGDARVWPPGQKVNADDIRRDPDAREKYGDRAGTGAIRLRPESSAALQAYPKPFNWDAKLPSGRPVARTKQYLQIGNAVPPLLALRVLESLWAPAPAVADVIELPAVSSIEDVAA